MKKTSLMFIAYGLLVFAGLFLFLSFVNPLVPYDADDWLYISELRKPIPMLHIWNPIKVFPETFMPLMSYFGVFVINPLINDYCRSFSIAHGLFGSIILTIYFVQFPILFYKRKFASVTTSIGYGCLFLLLHFISHIFKGYDNFFLIGSVNMTCFYNYVLPDVLNAALVMHFMSYGGVKAWYKNSSLFHKALVLIWTYFAIFSNLYSTAVLATYVGTELLLQLIKEIKSKSFYLKEYCIDNWQNLVLILWWFVANLIETTGGRAGDMQKSLIANLPITIIHTLKGIFVINVFIIIFEIAVFFLWNKKRTKSNGTLKRFMLYIGLELVYLIILSASVEASYMSRSEVTLCEFFYIFLGTIACLNQLIKLNKKNSYLLGILLGTFILFFINPGRLFCPYNFSYVSYDKCEAVMNDVINQFQAAQDQGLDEIDLEVPYFEADGNWPIADYIGERMAKAVYRFKITDKYITVKNLVITEEKNKQFGISSAR